MRYNSILKRWMIVGTIRILRIENNIFEALLEFLVDKSFPKIGLLLSVVVSLYEIDSRKVSSTFHKHRRTLIECDVVFYILFLSHLKKLFLSFRVLNVSQKLLAVCWYLFHQSSLFPIRRHWAIHTL